MMFSRIAKQPPFLAELLHAILSREGGGPAGVTIPARLPRVTALDNTAEPPSFTGLRRGHRRTTSVGVSIILY